jgi:hypothetical protein
MNPLKKMKARKVPGSTPTCIARKATSPMPDIGTAKPVSLRRTDLLRRNGKKSPRRSAAKRHSNHIATLRKRRKSDAQPLQEPKKTVPLRRFYITHLVKPSLTSQTPPTLFICCSCSPCTYTSVWQTIFCSPTIRFRARAFLAPCPTFQIALTHIQLWAATAIPVSSRRANTWGSTGRLKKYPCASSH